MKFLLIAGLLMSANAFAASVCVLSLDEGSDTKIALVCDGASLTSQLPVSNRTDLAAKSLDLQYVVNRGYKLQTQSQASWTKGNSSDGYIEYMTYTWVFQK